MRPLRSMDGAAAMTNARAASDALTIALVTAASRGLRPYCSDPGAEWLWLSEHEAERAEAARLCRGCLVIDPCGDAAEANQERWGVWAGVDRLVRPGRKASDAA
jgi:hypothetical protein